MVELNEAQRRSVTASDGPCLVLAGAGSGKTLVIVERLAWLIRERGIDPRHLLALTFTNKAADEMRRRVGERLATGSGASRARLGLWLGTFHSFGLHILRRERHRLGSQEDFTIFDDTDQLSLMKNLIKELGSKWLRVPPREALWWISRLKQNLAGPDPDAEPESPEEATYRELWRRYHAALQRLSALDFDDLLVLPVRLFEDHPDLRRRYPRRYLYIHVDEYQDTNRAQYVLARFLSGEHGNLFVVGDEDQSIYSWRGATLRNILDFQKDFPEAQVFRLEENYRSTAPILEAANAVVAHNTQRLGKTLWTARRGGHPARLYLALDEEDEARFVAEEIPRGDHRFRETAVLFRTHGQARVMEEALRRRGIPYVVVGGVEFYRRKEIKDLLAYLRVLVNPADDFSLRRILNAPPRGLGSATSARIEEYAAARACPLLAVLREVGQDRTFTERVRDSIAGFVRLIDELALMARETKAIMPIVTTLIERTGYRDHLQRGENHDYRVRLEVVDEFVSSCGRSDQTGPVGLAAFLQQLALLTDVDEWDSDAPAVALMTCHSAKGLEFDQVFLIGLEEGLLPHASAFGSAEEVEEERRLCYVAMTRARARLTLTAAQSRQVHGARRWQEVSRFLGEIPPRLLEQVSGDGCREEFSGQQVARTGGSDVERLTCGTRIRHATFGCGAVLYTTGRGNKLKARIVFESGRRGDFLVSAAPLEILEGDDRDVG